jgi:catechol 2,3-dioxygenase-like lactoylglutathione lyase family enzyme
MSDLTEGLAPYFNHFCYVVRDMDAAQAWFKRIMGVKHFGVTPIAMGPAMSARMRGKPCDFSIAYALGAIGGATGANIELIVPERSDNIYQQFLDRHGPGLHHIGFFVPDFDRAVEPFRARGLVPELEGDTEGSKFAYYDCEISPGYLVEIVHFADPEQQAAINQMTVAPE